LLIKVESMAKICCVWGCATRYTAKGVGFFFYRFPSEKSKSIQQSLWVRRLKRVDVVKSACSSNYEPEPDLNPTILIRGSL